MAVDVHAQLERLVADSVAPIARRYQFGASSLTPRPKWQPMVLIIGNFSSGKSTLINEILGGVIQRTGQAPTDDCFTIIVGSSDVGGGRSGDAVRAGDAVRVVEEIPGSTIINDPAMPFGDFKRFGSRFVSHFVMKRVNSPHLHNLALIDSPGMLDSVTERDRGYDYQEVLAQFAELADLVVLVFDPHRAGTIKETYDSIRSTLPRATSEDRVVFVMNRIDECKNLMDLVRCYGSLCWNLSQMTGRKDIPRIFMTYSPALSKNDGASFKELGGERNELIEKIHLAPKLQVSHSLGTVDNQLHRLEMITQAMSNAAKRFREQLTGYLQIAIGGVIVGAFVLDTVVASIVGHARDSSIGRLFGGRFLDWQLLFLIALLAVGAIGVYQHYRRRWRPQFNRQLLADVDELTERHTRYHNDLWESVRGHVKDLLGDPKNVALFSQHPVNNARIRRVIDEDLRKLYEAHVGRAPDHEHAPTIRLAMDAVRDGQSLASAADSSA